MSITTLSCAGFECRAIEARGSCGENDSMAILKKDARGELVSCKVHVEEVGESVLQQGCPHDQAEDGWAGVAGDRARPCLAKATSALQG